MDIFAENKHNKNTLTNVATEYLRSITKPKSNLQNNTRNTRHIIKLPWVPILGPKFGKEFENKDIKIVFMSKAKLKSIFCQNESNDTYPGVYLLNYSFNAEYIGETEKSDDQNNWTPARKHKGKMEKLRYDGILFKIPWSIQFIIPIEERYKSRKFSEFLEIKGSSCGSSKLNN